jgi:hypothetical protein
MIGRAYRILAVLTAGVLLACSPNGNGPAGTETRQVSGADDATLLASAAIRSNRLTTLPDECLQYSVSTSDAEFVIEVRENHRRPECKGDPQTAPRLFDVRIDRKTGAMMTNANAAPDTFRPLPPSR